MTQTSNTNNHLIIRDAIGLSWNHWLEVDFIRYNFLYKASENRSLSLASDKFRPDSRIYLYDFLG